MPSMNQSGSAHHAGPDAAGLRRLARGHVVLEGVHQLVAEHVVGFGEAAGERQDDAALEHLGDAAGAFADVAGERVRLLEVRMGGVEDERLPRRSARGRSSVDSRAYQRSAMRAASSNGRFFLRVVVDVEVLGLEHLEVEAVVLDLVGRSTARSHRWRTADRSRRLRPGART